MKGLFFGAASLLFGIAASAATPTAYASPSAPCQTCWTRTTTKPVPCPTGTFDPKTCITLDCVILKTTVIGTKSCAKVVTKPATCQTACPTGCGTFTETRTATSKCIPTSPSSCFTATATDTEPVFCPQFFCTGTPSGCGPKTTTVTRPPPNPYCDPTSTTTVLSTCPPNNCACTTTTVTKTATA